MEQLELTVPDVTERFRLDGGSGEIVREVRRANGVIAESRIPHLGHLSTDLSAAYDFNWLTVNAEPEGGPTLAAPIRCVDLFCGLGGMSLGLHGRYHDPSAARYWLAYARLELAHWRFCVYALVGTEL